jgi:translation initiation factor 1
VAPSGDRRVVYSTDGGSVRYCKRCGQPTHEGRCATTPASASATPGERRMSNDGVVRIARDRKGRGGKTMTVITGLPGDEAALAALAQTLKRLCGSGGTARDGVIEIQGDHREKLAAHLTKLGHRVKLAGG